MAAASVEVAAADVEPPEVPPEEEVDPRVEVLPEVEADLPEVVEVDVAVLAEELAEELEPALRCLSSLTRDSPECTSSVARMMPL